MKKNAAVLLGAGMCAALLVGCVSYDSSSVSKTQSEEVKSEDVKSEDVQESASEVSEDLSKTVEDLQKVIEDADSEISKATDLPQGTTEQAQYGASEAFK